MRRRFLQIIALLSVNMELSACHTGKIRLHEAVESRDD
jgi:hypothetical protein